MLDYFFPVGRVIVAAKIRFELATEDLQCSTLANTVCTNQPENLARSRHRKPMKLEAIGAIAVGNLAFQVGGKVDDGDGVEGALLGADTATNAERLGDEGQARLRRHFDAEFPAADNGARFLAFLATLARATLFSER